MINSFIKTIIDIEQNKAKDSEKQLKDPFVIVYNKCYGLEEFY